MDGQATSPGAVDADEAIAGGVSAYKRMIADAIQARSEKQYQSHRKFERAVDRNTYMRERKAEGKSVRAYRSIKIEERLPGEDDPAFRARIRRERRREAEGKPGGPRGYKDLSGLTPEQKAQRKKEQAAERKRKQRGKTTPAGSDGLTSLEIKAALADLDLS
ncbi:hypothetical protein [Bosea lathyri]|uniref:Uncharacterized protein n=1 Tax=Bosea lathyri TaxID=1036778 RepID=A0A1H6D8A2_9HYPH|nr:hypothetical protein [Bosea lathyri]SEG81328.1 hypothetical protein SAMN04488115_11810 [Bosea lathyri]